MGVLKSSTLSLFSLSALLIFLPYSNLIYAAKVPAGTILAKEQVLNVSITDNPSTIDPQRTEEVIGSRIAHDLYEGLMTEDENGNIIPGVAERYELSKDGKTYTFFIRKNAKFSDGSPITASDVVFSYRRLVDPKTASTYSFIAYPIQNATAITDGKKNLETLGIKAINPTTVEIILESPTPYFLPLIALTTFGIVKEANVTKYKDTFTQPGNLLSSGAYKLTYWKIGDKFTAVKNPYYWNAKNTVIQTVNYITVVDGNSEVQMYYAGQIDFTFTVPSDKIKSIKASIPKELRVSPYLGVYYFDLNMRGEPFKNNLKLRQALSMAIDRDILTKDVIGRGETPAYDLLPIGTANYTQQKYEWSTWSAEKRLQEAQKLYQEAGYSKDNPLKITITYNTDILHKKVTLTAASMWQKAFGNLGLKVALENQEWKVFLRTRQQGDYMVARDGWIADYNDASTFTNLLVTKNPQNNSGYTNPEYNAIQKEAEVEQNVTKRKELFEKGMRLALADYPIIPLYNYVSLHLVKPYVGGYTQKDPLDHIHTRNLYITDH